MHSRHRRLVTLRRSFAELTALSRRAGVDRAVLIVRFEEAMSDLAAEHERGIDDCNDLELFLVERCAIAARELLERQAAWG